MDLVALEDRLREFEPVLFALLFGSRAAGSERADSDWDLGVYLRPELSGRRRLGLRLELEARLADLGPLDVVPLNDAPPLLAQRALQGKRLLVRDPVAYVRFFVRSEALAGDEVHWRQLHRDSRERRLREGGFGRP